MQDAEKVGPFPEKYKRHQRLHIFSSWQELLFAKDTNTPKDNTTAEYPSYEFHTMSDVINALFAITELTDFSFELTNTKPPESPEWTAGIKVNGKGNGKYDADFCLFMENWIAKCFLSSTFP